MGKFEAGMKDMIGFAFSVRSKGCLCRELLGVVWVER
jgi:hypothetical protein